MFQFRPLPSLPYIFRQGYTEFLCMSSLIRTSPDQCVIDHSPRLNAVFHVLHRLLMPRHPPNALFNYSQILYFATVLYEIQDVNLYILVKNIHFTNMSKNTIFLFIFIHNNYPFWLSPTRNLVEVSGVEPLTLRLQSGCSTNWATPPTSFKLRRLTLLRQELQRMLLVFKAYHWLKLYQSSLLIRLVGLSRLERLTSPLSAECSNQLSYRPIFYYLNEITCRS